MALAAPEVRDVILRDGSTLRLRPPRASDLDAVLDFFGALSEQSVYWRFHGFPSLTAATVEPFLDPDWDEQGSLVGALSGDGETEQIVALASFVRLQTPRAPRSRSRSRTSCRGAESGRACSNSSPSRPRTRVSPSSSPR